MRMWGVDPRIMCRQHLLGEHVEMHMLVGSLRKNISVQGYIDDGLVNLHHIRSRHDDLVTEMIRRGYNHNSPLPAYLRYVRKYLNQMGKVDITANVRELASRCDECCKLQAIGGWYE